MNLKSHTKEEILQAYLDGKKVYRLTTDGHGEDDILIQDFDETKQNLIDDILYNIACNSEYDSGEMESPAILSEGWELDELELDAFLDNSRENFKIVFANRDLDEPYCLNEFGHHISADDPEYKPSVGYVIADSSGYVYWSRSDSSNDIREALSGTPIDDIINFSDWCRPCKGKVLLD